MVMRTWKLTLLTLCLALWFAAFAGTGSAEISVEQLASETSALPGESYSGNVAIRNGGDEAEGVRVFKSDYQFFSDGSNVYGQPGSNDRSNADWIMFRPNYLEILPESSAEVEFTVSVPEDPSLVGTYWSLLMVEGFTGADRGSGTDSAGTAMQAGIRQAIRYGVLVVTHIGDTGERAIRFTDRVLSINESGTRTLMVDVENSGERGLRPCLWVELHDSSGRKYGRFESEPRRLYPGTSVRFSVDLSDPPSGSYEALVVVDNGDEHVFGAQYSLEF